MGSRDFFESVREAALDAYRCARELAAIELEADEAGGLRAHGQGGAAHRVHEPNAYTADDRRIDRRRLLEDRLGQDRALVGLGYDVLYGRDGGAGIAGLLGVHYADVVYHRWVEAETWPRVADLSGYSVRYCHKMAGVAFDVMDAHGLTATVEASGLAEG